MLRRDKKGQSVIEYTLILGVILIVLFGLSPMIKRTSQSMIKFTADQLGNQAAGDQMFDSRTGHLRDSYSATRVKMDTTTQDVAGVVNYIWADEVFTSTNQLVNLGFQEN